MRKGWKILRFSNKKHSKQKMKIKVLNKEDNESRARNPTYTIEIPNEEIDHIIDRFGERFGKAFGEAIVKGLEAEN